MKNESSRITPSFSRLLLGVIYLSSFSLGFLSLFIWLVVPDLISWRTNFLELPDLVTFQLTDLYMLLVLPAALYTPVAFFPYQWSSEQSSEKRIKFMVYLLAVTIVGNLYTRFFTEGHLQSYFIPKGYFQCETEKQGHSPMMKTYEFAKDSKLCKDGVKG